MTARKTPIKLRNKLLKTFLTSKERKWWFKRFHITKVIVTYEVIFIWKYFYENWLAPETRPLPTSTGRSVTGNFPWWRLIQYCDSPCVSHLFSICSKLFEAQKKSCGCRREEQQLLWRILNQERERRERMAVSSLRGSAKCGTASVRSVIQNGSDQLTALRNLLWRWCSSWLAGWMDGWMDGSVCVLYFKLFHCWGFSLLLFSVAYSFCLSSSWSSKTRITLLRTNTSAPLFSLKSSWPAYQPAS